MFLLLFLQKQDCNGCVTCLWEMYHTLLAHFPTFGHWYNLPFLLLLLKMMKCDGKFSFFFLEPLSTLSPSGFVRGSFASGFVWTQWLEGASKIRTGGMGMGHFFAWAGHLGKSGSWKSPMQVGSSRNKLLLALASLKESGSSLLLTQYAHIWWIHVVLYEIALKLLCAVSLPSRDCVLRCVPNPTQFWINRQKHAYGT